MYHSELGVRVGFRSAHAMPLTVLFGNSPCECNARELWDRNFLPHLGMIAALEALTARGPTCLVTLCKCALLCTYSLGRIEADSKLIGFIDFVIPTYVITGEHLVSLLWAPFSSEGAMSGRGIF